MVCASCRIGDDSSNLEIAKHCLSDEGNPTKAAIYLNRVLQSEAVSEELAAQAKQMLREAKADFEARTAVPSLSGWTPLRRLPRRSQARDHMTFDLVNAYSEAVLVVGVVEK